MTKSFDKLFSDAEKREAYWVADVKYRFAEDLDKLAHIRRINRADLARLIRKSPAYITKVFRGDTNFTISTMVKLARALRGRIHIHVAPDGPNVAWVYTTIDKPQVSEPTLDWIIKENWIRPTLLTNQENAKTPC